MMRLQDRAYQLVLCAFPAAFRRRHGAEMAEHFAYRRSIVAARPMAAGWLWMRALSDALGNGLALRLADLNLPKLAAALVSTLGRGIRPMTPRNSDLRQALRSLRKSPWYSATVVAVIALSTALSATVFAIVDGELIKPLPYRDADGLYRAYARRQARGGYAFTMDEIASWRETVPALQFSAMQTRRGGGTLGDGRQYGAISVDEQFFDLLGYGPMAGGFAPEHFRVGADPVAIISYRLWQRAFAGSHDTIGRVLPLVGATDHVGRPAAPPIVVGILPRDFVFPDFSNEIPDVVRPLALPASAFADRNESALTGLVRITKDTPLASVQPRLDAAIQAQQPSDVPKERRFDGVSLRALSELALPFAKSFQTLASVAATLTLLACLGICGLSAARARQRDRDVVLRRALGATGWDLFRQSVAEVAPPVFLGSALGILAAPMLLNSTLALLPLQTAFLKPPAIDPRVVAIAVALATVTTLIIALGVLRTTRKIQRAAPGATSVTARVRGFGGVIVAAQSGLAFALTLGGALVVTSLWNVWQIDPGYDAGRVAVVQVSMTTADAQRVADDALAMNGDLARLPGVTAAGVFGAPLLVHSSFIMTVRLHPEATPLEMQQIPHAGDLAGVLGLAPVRGRFPNAEELARRDPIVVVSERAGESLWPGENPLGRILFIGARASAVTVVGVARDLQFSGLADRPRAAGQVYTSNPNYRQLSFLLRTNGAAEAIAAAARAAVASHRDRFDVLWSGTMEDALAGSIADRRFAAWAYGGFAVCALAITAVGILGLVAMLASLRVREMAIRVALGADSWRLVRQLVREQLLAAALGLVGGGLFAAWSIDALRREVYGITTSDSVVWTATAMMILTTTSVGTLIPALRAAAVDPIKALRTE
jgi:predicted permease